MHTVNPRPIIEALHLAAPLKTLGDFPPEASYATVAFCINSEEMPSMEAALDVFKDVPAKLIEVPVETVIKALMLFSEVSEEFGSFEKYHAWYLTNSHVPNHSPNNRWPCIASDDKYEFILDGWHRMHSYIRNGHKTIPILQYDYPEWWKAHAIWKTQYLQTRLVNA